MKSKELLKELRGKQTKDLIDALNVSRKKIVELRFSAKLRKLKNYNSIGVERKKIAQIWTILNEKVTADLAQKTEEKVNNA